MQEGNHAESIIKIISRPARSVKQSSSRLLSGNPAIRVRRLTKRTRTLYSTQFSIREYIIYPHHEHNASSNFVVAGRLARKLGIINIYVLYLHADIDSTCTPNIANLTGVHSTFIKLVRCSHSLGPGS